MKLWKPLTWATASAMVATIAAPRAAELVENDAPKAGDTVSLPAVGAGDESPPATHSSGQGQDDGAGSSGDPLARTGTALIPAPSTTAAPPTTITAGVGATFEAHRTQASWYDAAPLTTAHRTLPFGTRLEVCAGSRCVVVTVADRGPFVAGRDLDLSRDAFERLAPASVGVLAVTWAVV